MLRCRALRFSRSILDEMQKLPDMTERQRLEMLADQILSLRLRDFVRLNKTLDESLNHESVIKNFPQGRSPFPNPLGFFK